LIHLQLTSLSIGNEIDAYLGTNASKWNQYQIFFNATKTHAKTRKLGINVGTKAQFDGLTGYAKEYLKKINQISDVIMVTYYPLNSDFTVKNPRIVKSDFDALTSIYRDKPIFILECGYPSSNVLKSSERKQGEFVREVFKTWDAHASQIQLISFTWLHDVSQATVEEWSAYYGISDLNFKEYLQTLGLRTWDGKDKKAFVALKEEAKTRGW